MNENNYDVTMMVNLLGNFIRNKQEVRVIDVLDFILPYMKEEDFILKKKYKIRDTISSVFGKWPQTYGNAFYVDSKYLLQDLIQMTNAKVKQYLKRNGFGKKDMDFVDQLFAINTRRMNEKTINTMAINIIGHFDNREHIYVYD